VCVCTESFVRFLLFLCKLGPLRFIVFLKSLFSCHNALFLCQKQQSVMLISSQILVCFVFHTLMYMYVDRSVVVVVVVVVVLD
jgi:hypothetical protein